MDDLIGEAAHTLLPLLTAGAGAATTAMAEQSGARMADGAASLLAKLRSRVSREPTETEVRTALAATLDEGEITPTDLLALLKAIGPTSGTTNISGKIVYANTVITVTDGSFNGGSVGP